VYRLPEKQLRVIKLACSVASKALNDFQPYLFGQMTCPVRRVKNFVVEDGKVEG